MIGAIILGSLVAAFLASLAYAIAENLTIVHRHIMEKKNG